MEVATAELQPNIRKEDEVIDPKIAGLSLGIDGIGYTIILSPGSATIEPAKMKI